jgi:hypothetical protein
VEDIGSFYEQFKCELDCSRGELASDERRRPMKTWSSTSSGPQRIKWSEIDSPEVKNADNKSWKGFKWKISAVFMNNSS